MSTASTSSTSTGTAAERVSLRCTRLGAARPATVTIAAPKPATSATIEFRIGVSVQDWRNAATRRRPCKAGAGFVTLYSDRVVGMGVRQPERVGDRFVGNPTIVNIETGAQILVFRQCPAPSLLGQRQHIGNGGIAEREGGGARHRARHIGHAI